MMIDGYALLVAVGYNTINGAAMSSTVLEFHDRKSALNAERNIIEVGLNGNIRYSNIIYEVTRLWVD